MSSKRGISGAAASGKRVEYIDIVRGIAILAIIFGHLGLSHVNQVVFTFHVPIFFLITGYFLKTNSSVWDFVRKKFKTLIVPYLITCAVTIVLAVIISALFDHGVSLKSVFLDWVYASAYGSGSNYTEPFYIKQIGALWFLLATFWGSILLRLILGAKDKMRPFLVLVVVLFGFLTHKYLFQFPLSIQAGCCAVLFMYFGFIWRSMKEKMEKLPLEAKFVAILFALFVWVSFILSFRGFSLVSCNFGRGIIDIVGVLCACFIVVKIAKLIEKYSEVSTKVLSFLGKYSLLMLCAHIIELNLFPWGRLTDHLVSYGIPGSVCLYVMVTCKLVWIIGVTFLCTKSEKVLNLFGMKKA